MKNAATICAVLAAATVPSMCEPQDINLSSLGFGDINISGLISSANALLSSYQSDLASIITDPAAYSSLMAGMSDMPTVSGSSNNHNSEETTESSGVSSNYRPVFAGMAAAVSAAMAALI